MQASGLDLEDANKLGIEVLTSKETAQLHPGHAVTSLLLQYHDLRGRPTKMHRVRLLEVTPGAFGEVPEKPLRYLQPAGSPPAVYLPRTVDWGDVASDPERVLLITEGELKAACAAKHGFACLGLGGVSSWRSAKLGWDLLPELEELRWARRDVVIVFDSDAKSNPNVAAASVALAKELRKRGALVSVAVLPELEPGVKCGLDDFLVARGAEALDELVEGGDKDDLALALWGFNERFAMVLSPGVVFDRTSGASHDPTKFKSTLFANIYSTRQVVNGMDTRIQKVSVAKEWIAWPSRSDYESFTYAPGKPQHMGAELNLWEGWGVEPKEGDIEPWKKLLDYLFTDAPPEVRAWFEHWCLYPLRFPGTKLNTAAAIWSREQGIGKSLIGATLGKIYGRKNYSEISQQELESGFNGWAANRQLIMIDDVSGHDSRAKADVMKKLITQEYLQVNIKYVPTYALPDCVNYYLTSNRENALYLEDQDRRFFVHEVTAPRLDKAFYHHFVEVWRAGGGPGALLYYALHDHDFGVFQPKEAAPMTEAKRDMLRASATDFGAWAQDLKADPDAALGKGEDRASRDLWTATELAEEFNRSPRRKGSEISSRAAGNILTNEFRRTKKTRVGSETVRFYILRNELKWSNASAREITIHVENGRSKEQGARKY